MIVMLVSSVLPNNIICLLIKVKKLTEILPGWWQLFRSIPPSPPCTILCELILYVLKYTWFCNQSLFPSQLRCWHGPKKYFMTYNAEISDKCVAIIAYQLINVFCCGDRKQVLYHFRVFLSINILRIEYRIELHTVFKVRLHQC